MAKENKVSTEAGLADAVSKVPGLASSCRQGRGNGHARQPDRYTPFSDSPRKKKRGCVRIKELKRKEKSFVDEANHASIIDLASSCRYRQGSEFVLDNAAAL